MINSFDIGYKRGCKDTLERTLEVIDTLAPHLLTIEGREYLKRALRERWK